jgi:aminoglycoside phosphotransferase (APT) family kinase protein
LQKYATPGCEADDHDIAASLSAALRSGKVVWTHFARAVVQLDDRIAVKLGPKISLTDADMSAHIRRHSVDIPVPQPLGVLSLGGMTYAFMTLIEGCSLDKLWPDLSNAEKCSVRDQLDAVLGKLRSLPLPSQYLGGGTPPHCIDCRMWKRQSPEWIESEAQFNKFLLSGNRRSGMEPYVQFVRPMLRENHHIVLTHGDLHPRNILAIRHEDGGGRGIQVTGLIDWEVGGA